MITSRYDFLFVLVLLMMKKKHYKCFSNCESMGLLSVRCRRRPNLQAALQQDDQQPQRQDLLLLAASDATLYASPYLVATPQGYTKHYYAESERITSQIGRGNFSTLVTPVTDTATANRKVRRADSLVLALNPSITDTAAQLSYLTTLTNRQKDTCEAYWYHPDHLGSSSWITYSDGSAVQHLHYLPWGEDFVDQRSTSWNAMYTFSAKEKDTETGYSYFGVRYYSSDLSVWLSVDPMSDKYPPLSPYVYCANNPINIVDPDGEDIIGALIGSLVGATTEIISQTIANGMNNLSEGKGFFNEWGDNMDGQMLAFLQL